jgi:hypothetical protein
MSWGVATQNGVSVGLASIVSISCGATEFSPASLFTSGVVGAWYDPSDYTSLFQDSAGTTAVTAVEQPVGLMLDKSQGLVLGSELVTGAASAYTGNGTVATVGDTVTATCTTNGVYGIKWGSSNISNTWVSCTFEVVTNSASRSLQFFQNLAASSVLTVGTTVGQKSGILFAPTASGGSQAPAFIMFGGIAGESFSVRLVSVKSLPGNHALQATSASRPILRARYNLLTYSEHLDNAAWAPSNATRSVGVTDPNGGTTAATITTTAANGYIRYAFSAGALSATNSIWIRRRTGTGPVYLNSPDNATAVTTSLTSSWQRFQISSTGTIISLIVVIQTSSDAIDIAFPQMNYGSSAGTYQRIAAATDYDTVGFLPYLALITDDSFATNSIDFSATDKMSVVAGVTKLSDAAQAVIAELSATIATNNGSFLMTAPNSAAANFNFSSKGTTQVDNTVTTYASPYTAVLAGSGNIAGGTNSLKVNGGTATTVTSSQGTGNYGNYPLYIGRRGGSTLPLNGNIYQIVVCGKTLSASELASTEAYVNQKTGAY